MPGVDVQDTGASPSEAATEALREFEIGALDPAKFPHAEHVRLGFEMLARHPFGEALMRFSRGLQLLAAKAGRPQLYHETITVAFLALINERRARGGPQSWSEFTGTNPDLFDRRLPGEMVQRAEQLASDLAGPNVPFASRSGGFEIAVLRKRRSR